MDIKKKFSNIDFIYKSDKEIFITFLLNILKEIQKYDSKKLSDLIQIIEYDLIKYSDFNKKVLYNPIKLMEALSNEDFLWEKINTDELSKIIENMECFKKYLYWELKEKDFLEKKYWIKIILVKEDFYSISAWIFWNKLTNFNELNLIKKLKKLISFYPINFIKNIKLDSIIIVNNFYKKDIYWIKINLWGFATSSDNNIYLSRENLVESFDHELFHQAMQYYDDFDKWWKIRKRQKKKYLYKHIDKQVHWFARNYWKENISEDQATMAEELILNYRNLHKRITKDKKLSLKLKLIKSAYFKLSDWIMNKNWWRNKNL